jgi:ATP-dependent protease ClpP protease subunit
VGELVEINREDKNLLGCFFEKIPKYFGIVSKTKKDIKINIDFTIGEPKDCREIIDTLNNASKNDKIIFRINTNGGSVRAAIEICNAILETKASTTAEIYQAYSAGALIAFHCQNIIIKKYSMILIHSLQTQGLAGQPDLIYLYADTNKKQNKDLIGNTFKGFLSQQEIDSVLLGRELFIYEDDIKIKIKNWEPLNNGNN